MITAALRCMTAMVIMLAPMDIGAAAPRASVSPTVAEHFAPSPAVSTAPVPDGWWRLFDDPRLDNLVEASLAANTDLRMAYANLDGARAALRQARAARLPKTGIESSAAIDNPSTQPSAASVSATDYDVAATINWDIDLFGRLRSGALAARADADAQAAASDGMRIAVVADTVLAYIDFCGASRNLAVAKDIVAIQDRNVRRVEEQLRAGEVSPLELSQAQNLRDASGGEIAPFETLRDNALYRLAMLQGSSPAAARKWGLQCAGVPQMKGGVPAGDGTALLLRRPDIRETERKMAAATARIGVARADLYPTVNLGGALGLLAGGFSAAASPLISWAFPNQGPARAAIAKARASERAALAAWDGAMIRALKEVETALSAYEAQTRRNAALRSSLQSAALYARRAEARVRIGDADPLLRIDGERMHATARLQQAGSDLSVAQAQVALFRALGGGWQSAPAPLALQPSEG